MLASATEVEVELHVPDNLPTFFGVTWAQDPREEKIFVKAFPRGPDGRRGILESTGLVEVGDCLTAINDVPLDNFSGLHEVIAGIRAAGSPLSLRFARYPPPHSSSCSTPSSSPPLPRFVLSNSTSAAATAVRAGGKAPPSAAADSAGSNSSSSGSSGGSIGSLSSHHGFALSGGGGSGGGGGGGGGGGAGETAGTEDAGKRGAPDPELDDVLNCPLVVGMGERVAGIQKRNTQLIEEVDRIARATADKRQEVEAIASAAASLTAAGVNLLPQGALRLLSTARQDAAALCGTMARLDEMLAARERAQMARRRTLGHDNRR